jgi:hypothetical protein
MLNRRSSSHYLAMLAILGVCSVVFGEVYARWSSHYLQPQYVYLKHVMNSRGDAANAAFGDSQVGSTSYIKGFNFLGNAGQQPTELLHLVKYLYTCQRPHRAIVMASPQWFGGYHAFHNPILIDGALPNRFVPIPLLISSSLVYSSIGRNLAADLKQGAEGVISSARADEFDVSQSLDPIWKRYLAALDNISKVSVRPDYNWSLVGQEDKNFVTLFRVSGQNPVPGFATSAAAAAFKGALAYLQHRGAKVCLFRTPVTRVYLDFARRFPNSRFAEFDDYVRALAVEMNMPYVDFRSFKYEFDDAKFFNQDHLSEKVIEQVWALAEQACF